MNLPPISPVKNGVSHVETESPVFKRSGINHSPDTSAFKQHFDQEVLPGQPRFMTGYGGFQPQQDLVEEVPRVIVAPVVGYTGNYRGKNIGKLGRCEVHKTRLSAWDKDTVSGILGVPNTHNDWEYSHYTNGCENFCEKKYHETSPEFHGSFVSSMGSLSLASTSGDHGNNLDTSQHTFPDGLATAHNARNSPSLLLHQHVREETETDRILMCIQQHLESSFKTSIAARSGLKTAFFALDRCRSGTLPRKDFFAALHKVAGVVLSEERCLHLACALSAAGRHHEQGRVGFEGEGEGDWAEERGGGLDGGSLELDVDRVNYGRFLNILVPRAASLSVGPGSASKSSKRRQSVSASN